MPISIFNMQIQWNTWWLRDNWEHERMRLLLIENMWVTTQHSHPNKCYVMQWVVRISYEGVSSHVRSAEQYGV